MEDLNDLTRHLEWADATLWRSVLESCEDGLDSKVEFWLHHIHATQNGFTCMWRGEPVEVPELSSFPDPGSLLGWARQVHGRIQAFLAGAGPAELGKDLDISSFRHQLEERWGTISPVSVGQSVLQVAFHTAHHRGQVAARLREIGGKPPTVDFIAWLWQGRPEPSWPPS